MSTMKLSDLKEGMEIPIDTIFEEIFVPVYGPGDEVRMLRIPNVPVVALLGGKE